MGAHFVGSLIVGGAITILLFPALVWIVKTLWNITVTQREMFDNLEELKKEVLYIKTNGSDKLESIISKTTMRGIAAGLLTLAGAVFSRYLWRDFKNDDSFRT